jgi:hypothetical protein
MLLVPGGLYGWDLAAPRLDCLAAALCLVPAAGLIMLSGTEAAFFRRCAFLGRYLEAGGVLYRLLSRRILILIVQFVKSFLLGVVLLVGALGLSQSQWLLLLADVAVLIAVWLGLSSLLKGEIQEAYRGPMTRHWAARSTATLLWLGLVALMFISPQENYAGLRWEEVLAYVAAQPTVGCDDMAVLTRLAAIWQALGLWAAQHLFAGLHQPAQAAAAWIFFAFAFGASFLFAWSYSLALTGLVAWPWAVWQPREHEA